MRRLLVFISLALGTLVACNTVSPPQPAPRVSHDVRSTDAIHRASVIRERLAAAHTTVNFDDVTIDDVATFLSKASDTIIIVAEVAREGRSRDELTIFLRLDAPESVARILDLTTSFRGLVWTVTDGIVQITAPQVPRGEMTIQLYDVKDLAHATRDFVGCGWVLDPVGDSLPERR